MLNAAIRASDETSYPKDAFLLIIHSAIKKTIGIKMKVQLPGIWNMRNKNMRTKLTKKLNYSTQNLNVNLTTKKSMQTTLR